MFNVCYYYSIMPNTQNLKLSAILSCLVFSLVLSAQGNQNVSLAWKRVSMTFPEPHEQLTFEGALADDRNPTWPYYAFQMEVSSPSEAQVSLQDAVWEPVERDFKPFRDDVLKLSSDALIEVTPASERNRHYVHVRVLPVRKNANTGALERLVSFKLSTETMPAQTQANPRLKSIINSVLASGTFYKVSLKKTGVYKMDFNFLRDLGINMNGLDPRRIQVFGHKGGQLPEAVAAARPADLPEIAIKIEGEADGVFNNGDAIYFYAEAPERWYYDETQGMYLRESHDYSDDSYFFIKVNGDPHKTLGTSAHVPGNYDVTVDYFDHYAHYERNLFNLLDQQISTEPAGREWLGESFRFQPQQNFTLSVGNFTATQSAKVMLSLANSLVLNCNASTNYRCTDTTTFRLLQAGRTIATNKIPCTCGVDFGSEGRLRRFSSAFLPTGSGSNMTFTLNHSASYSGGEGYLDYITLNVRSALDVNTFGGQMTFREANAHNGILSHYHLLNNPSNLEIWDVSDFYNAKLQEVQPADGHFTVETRGEKREFVAFIPSAAYVPTAAGAVANQNLHGASIPHAVFVYHPDFEAAAQRLATHRRQFDNIDVLLVNVQQIYNEFSAGRQDVTAIRDFASYLLENDVNGKFDALLLMGDASVDYKGFKYPGSNFVPTYENKFATLAGDFHPVYSFNTDDYFGLLTQDDGVNVNTGMLDIGVGRLPVKSLAEAEAVVDKIVRYENDLPTLNAWKLRTTFVADDGDSGSHHSQADDIANWVRTNYPVYNVDKIYLDAYQQIATSAGERSPDCTAAIENEVFNGTLIVTYLGHGSPSAWMQEQCFTSRNITALNNRELMPLFMTATCSFAPFDDPNVVSAGEQLVLNPDGGSIAAMTTVRPVFAFSNAVLTQGMFNHMFERNGAGLGTPNNLGNVMRLGKNEPPNRSDNSRRFTLLGDPSMRLNYPRYTVVTDSMNGLSVSATSRDTIRAQQRVTISGHIEAVPGQIMTNFNGTIFVTIFDKPTIQRTRGNENNIFAFTTQNSVVFRGRATVQNGKFRLTFAMPSNINFSFGQGRISYYAQEAIQQDAAAAFTSFIIGGSDTTALADNEPPVVQVFMNDDRFVDGGITNTEPFLYVKLSDDNGINTSSSGIGQDIAGRLELDKNKVYILNDFYESDLNDYRRGVAKYKLSKLPEGKHTAIVKAWDTRGNSGEGKVDFVVANSGQASLAHVLNYPNPFTTSTNFQFEHNMPGVPMDVMVQVFTSSGKLVKTIQKNMTPQGYRVDDIQWDGLDDFGDKLARGVYVYKVSVRSAATDGKSQENSQFEKLVILR